MAHLFLSQLRPEGSPLPSFYELLMHAKMKATLKPAFKHAFQAMIESYSLPIGLLTSMDEIYLIVQGLYEGYFLYYHGLKHFLESYGIKVAFSFLCFFHV